MGAEVCLTLPQDSILQKNELGKTCVPNIDSFSVLKHKIKKLCLSVFDQKFMILNRYSYLESVGRAAPDLGKAQNILSWVRPRLETDPGLSR